MDKNTVLNMVRQRIAEVEQIAEQNRNNMLAAIGAIQELKQLAARFDSMQELPQEAEKPKE